jgi:peroxiredoxin
VGEVAPKFELNNQAGKATSLADLVKNMPVALIFYRSADW